MSTQLEYFVDGGTLGPENPSYVPRSADQQLLQKVLEGAFCYVLTARQMGKSSLMIRTARGLRERGVAALIVDLTTIGSRVSASEWYLGLLSRIKGELTLQADVVAFWSKYDYLSTQQRFINFLYDVVLKEVTSNVAIFIDEIDTTLSLNFRDDFFAAIRALYNARASDPVYHRLTFVLLGVATPTDLIEDLKRTPFNIGTRILLQEFSYTDAAPLRQGLELAYSGQSERILKRIFHWTGGHPYLTQRLCLKAVEARIQLWDDAKIDDLVATNFLSDEARRDPNLIFVRDRIRTIPLAERQAMLKLYRQIYTGRRVSDDERSQPQLYLKLFGLVRAEQGQLQVCNAIYQRVFDEAWIDENLRGIQTGRLVRARQMNWIYVALIAIVLVALVAIVAIVFLSR